jgi:hypothetical protein
LLIKPRCFVEEVCADFGHCLDDRFEVTFFQALHEPGCIIGATRIAALAGLEPCFGTGISDIFGMPLAWEMLAASGTPGDQTVMSGRIEVRPDGAANQPDA